MRKQAQVAKDISLIDNDITSNTFCVEIRDASENVTLQGNRIHDCRSGIVGPGNPPAPRVTGLKIVDNVIENMYEDGIQFGNWDNTLISHNVIRHISDPENVIHNDALQFTGNASKTTISDNTFYDVGHGQLLFIQPQFGPIDGVHIENNLMWNLSTSAAYAVQSQGATGVEFLYNTIWVPHWSGAILLRHQPVAPYTAATDTQLVGNIVSKLDLIEGAAMSVNSHNSIGGDPAFVDPSCGNFRLSDESPARGTGDPQNFPELDLAGHHRTLTPSIGALEWVASTPRGTSTSAASFDPGRPTGRGRGNSGRWRTARRQPGPAFASAAASHTRFRLRGARPLWPTDIPVRRLLRLAFENPVAEDRKPCAPGSSRSPRHPIGAPIRRARPLPASSASSSPAESTEGIAHHR